MSRENEKGFVVCRNNRRYTRGTKGSHSATSHSVVIPMSCPSGSRPVAIHHTHPGGSLNLSPPDKAMARQFRVPVCVKAQGRVKCYRVREKS